MFQNTNISPHTLIPTFSSPWLLSPQVLTGLCSALNFCCAFGGAVHALTPENMSFLTCSQYVPGNSPTTPHLSIIHLRSNTNLFTLYWQRHRNSEYKMSFPAKLRAGAAVWGTECESALGAEKMSNVWNCVFQKHLTR